MVAMATPMESESTPFDSGWQDILQGLELESEKRDCDAESSEKGSNSSGGWDRVLEDMTKLSQQESIASDMAECFRSQSPVHSRDSRSCCSRSRSRSRCRSHCSDLGSGTDCPIWAGLLKQHLHRKWPSSFEQITLLSACSGSFSESEVLKAQTAETVI